MLTLFTELLSRIRAFFRRGRFDFEFGEELESHLTMLEQENTRRGMKPQEARRAALLALGGSAQLREAHRDARALPFLDSLMQDIRYALRSLRKTPGFTAAVILTLGIGIGANTAIFSTIDETLFRPLDFPHSEQLVDVFAFNKASGRFLSSSYPDYEDLRDRAKAVQLAAFVRMPMNVARGQHTGRLPVEAVTGNFFSLLKMPPVAGRAFRDGDDLADGGRVAMVSETIAGADSIGARITIEDQPFTVIGIVSKRYHGTNLNWGDAPRVWIPLHAAAIVQPRFQTLNIFHQRSMQWLLITGRLKPGFSATQAQAEIRTVASGIARSNPATNRDITAAVFSASQSKFWPSYRASITRSLMVFAVAAALVLLLTCANLSNLLLNRSLGRRREFAIRLSIGAGRARLMRQLLTETILLSVPGCAAALAIAYGLSGVLAHFPNALGLPLALDGRIDIRVLCFCIALSVATAVFFGLTPALQAARADVLPALKESGNTVSGTNSGIQNSFLALQIAFTMILLTGGGLFGRSVMKAWSIDPGFKTEGLLTASFSPPASGTGSLARFRRAQDDLTERLLVTAGVQSVTLTTNPPFDSVRGQVPIEAEQIVITADRQGVGPDFFKTLGMPLRSGREFNRQDIESAPKVAIVNEALASRLWPGTNPLGRIIEVHKAAMRVVGVARNSKYSSAWGEAQPSLYVACSQEPGAPGYLIARSDGNPKDFDATLTREWNDILPRSPLYDFSTANDLRNVALAPQRMAVWVFGSFGLIAVVLASVGLYSSVSYAVARRTREIGIRLAIGAKPAAIVRQLVFRSMTLAVAGLAAGTAISVLLAPSVASYVRGVPVHDGVTFAFVITLVGIIALLASAIPARRAARIDPQAALRSE